MNQRVRRWLSAISVRALTALSEDPGLVPRAHMAAHNCLYFLFQGVLPLPPHPQAPALICARIISLPAHTRAGKIKK